MKILCMNPVITKSARKKPEGSHNASQLHIEKWSGHFASFVTIPGSSACYIVYQANNSVRNYSAINLSSFRKCDRRTWWHLVLTLDGKDKSMIHVLYILQLAKRHILGWNNIEQLRNQALSAFHCWVWLGWKHKLGS